MRRSWFKKNIPKQRPNAEIVTTSGPFALTYPDLQFRNCAASWHSGASYWSCAKIPEPRFLSQDSCTKTRRAWRRHTVLGVAHLRKFTSIKGLRTSQWRPSRRSPSRCQRPMRDRPARRVGFGLATAPGRSQNSTLAEHSIERPTSMTDLQIARRTLLAQSGLGIATAFGVGFGPGLEPAEARAGPGGDV